LVNKLWIKVESSFCMPNHNNRVLGRMGARLLTMEESERVGGSIGTGTGCVSTGPGRNDQTDIFCEDCPDC
jgi:hypothetical protein